MPEIIFNGPEGRLEGRYHHSKRPNAPLALVLHPDPQLGGTMNNKITHMMFHAFAQRGFSVLRFNFRGVGKSQGVHDHGEGELSDAAAALDWLQDFNKNSPYVWIAGFSFGAWIAMQLLMRRPEMRGFISVSPPANMHDFTFLAPCPTSGLIVHGGHDNVVPTESVNDLVARLNAQRGIKIDYRVIDEANHFFHNHTEMLESIFHDHLEKAGEKLEASPFMRPLVDQAKAA